MDVSASHQLLYTAFPSYYKQGRSQDFSKGGVTLCQSEGTHQIVMSFSPPVVGCLLKKTFTKGGSQAPQEPPGYAPAKKDYCYLGIKL